MISPMDEYTEDDVRWLAGRLLAEHDREFDSSHLSWQDFASAARGHLDAIAERWSGRLLPADAREEWAVELFPAEENGGKPYIVQTEDGSERAARFVAAGGPGKLIRRWVGPWVPVEPEAAGDGAVNGSLLLAFAGGFGESDSPQANPKALCSHCGQAGDLRPYGQDPTMLCADPCHDLVGGGHPATAPRPGRGPCPDCTTEGAPSWDAVEKIARAHAAVARTRRPNYARAVEEAPALAVDHREHRPGCEDRWSTCRCFEPAEPTSGESQ